MGSLDKAKIHTKYLWLDLEMTGLDIAKEKIIEVGAIITDTSLNEISNFHEVVFQNQELLDNMDDWNKKHHGASGLIEKIPKAKKETEVEKLLCDWCKEHFDEPIILAGNSIGQDRLFLEKYFKEFSKLLHYRQLDVTSFKLPFMIAGLSFTKKNTHRAVDDIKESIAEFKFYWSHFKA